MQTYIGSAIQQALIDTTFQREFPKTVTCSLCNNVANPIIVINDLEAEIAHASPKRNRRGRPIWPHDSAAFVLYMCSECGEVSVEWNQA